jgi:hypothetical protein
LQDKFIQENSPNTSRSLSDGVEKRYTPTNNQVSDRKAAPHNFMKNQWVLEKSFEYLHKNTKLAAKYKGPYQFVRVLPHDNVEIRLSARRKSIVQVNKFKPYHSKGEFQT